MDTQLSSTTRHTNPTTSPAGMDEGTPQKKAGFMNGLCNWHTVKENEVPDENLSRTCCDCCYRCCWCGPESDTDYCCCSCARICYCGPVPYPSDKFDNPPARIATVCGNCFGCCHCIWCCWNVKFKY